jgi:hypothetical protein
MQLHPDLQFLNKFIIDPADSYRTAIWLLSDFDNSSWIYSFGFKKPKTLNWNVKLADTSLLTDEKNLSLLTSLKYFLTSSTRSNGGHVETNDLKVQQRVFSQTCRIIDLLLLNSDRYEFHNYGFSGLTSGNLKEILEQISSSPTTAESIYTWSSKLKTYCLDLYNKTDKAEIVATLEANPQMKTITNIQKDNDTLGIPHELIPAVRACLFLKDLYHLLTDTGNTPNSLKISKVLYPQCIWGNCSNKPTHGILCYTNGNEYLFNREYPTAPVTTGLRIQMNETHFLSYRSRIYNLGTLLEIGMPGPTIEALIEIENFFPDTAKKGRYQTLPSALVFRAIRQAIEFHIKNSNTIIKGFCRLAIAAKRLGKPLTSLTTDQFQSIVGSKVLALGVERLTLIRRREKLGVDVPTRDKTTYFSDLRNNRGFFELIAIYIGSVQLLTGVLMARRASEMYGLMAGNCLDTTEQWLIFLNAKSSRHLFGARQTLARPIEPIAIDMIKTLIKMQKILVRAGYIKKMQTLFAAPDFRGALTLIDSSRTTYNRNLDLFCDYFETPLNHQKQRAYIRQHQLRRFFAMVFFYCGSFGKLDTLRWMLGHNDPNHVWNYITESLDGAVLTGAKAQYVAEAIHNGASEGYEELEELIKSRYGTTDFGLIEASDLEDHISSLIEDGMVEIEPEFFTDHRGQQFKIVARLTSAYRKASIHNE